MRSRRCTLVSALLLTLSAAFTVGCGPEIHRSGGTTSTGGRDLAVEVPEDMHVTRTFDLAEPPAADLAGVPCGLQTCQSVGAGCGPISDGCGVVLNCGGCDGGLTCGGGGKLFACGNPAKCTPRTCADVGANCGSIGDGCGSTIMCGSITCPTGQVCGAGGVPNVCSGSASPIDGGVVSSCSGGAKTSISGTVLAPTNSALGYGNPDPIYNAEVYIPSGSIDAITTGATCDQCTTPQAAYVSTTTAIDGTFTLNDPPSGSNIPVVIQLGKWRRVSYVTVTPCIDNALTADQTRLPRKQAEFNQYDNIPRFAVSTGSVDALECVLLKMGVDSTQFTNPSVNGAGLPTGTGRVHLYTGAYNGTNGAGGAEIDGTTPNEHALWGNATTLNAYDAVLFPCTGGQDNKALADQNTIISYTGNGGRAFFTHFNYVWLVTAKNFDKNTGESKAGTGPASPAEPQPFVGTATWTVNNGDQDVTPAGYIDQSFPKGMALATWLQQSSVKASTTLGQIPVSVARDDLSAVIAPAQQWMYSQTPADNASFPLHFTFNTPLPTSTNPSPQQCGRVVFSDFHVENVSTDTGAKFPKECGTAAPLTPQEKLLEFLLFDLTSCVGPDVPVCTPKTCAQQGFNCGMQGDTCGNILPMSCGDCTPPQSCGGGGTPGVCGAGGCTGQTCASAEAECGTIGNGCGGTVDCGPCPTGQVCGGFGAGANQCGSPPN